MTQRELAPRLLVSQLPVRKLSQPPAARFPHATARRSALALRPWRDFRQSVESARRRARLQLRQPALVQVVQPMAHRLKARRWRYRASIARCQPILAASHADRAPAECAAAGCGCRRAASRWQSAASPELASEHSQARPRGLRPVLAAASAARSRRDRWGCSGPVRRAIDRCSSLCQIHSAAWRARRPSERTARHWRETRHSIDRRLR